MDQTIFVVGMHRSGTSVVAGSLMRLGGAAPSTMVGANEFNPKGHFEPDQAVTYNDAFLTANGRRWDDALSVPTSAFAAEDYWVAGCADVLVHGFPAGTPKVVKDPRISILLPLWQAAAQKAGVNPVFVHVLRDPQSVADSIQRRDGYPADHALALWLRYTLDAERDTRGYRRSLLPIGQFITDPIASLDRIGVDLGLDWPIPLKDVRNDIAQFVDPSLLRRGAVMTAALADLAQSAYTLMLSLAATPDDPVALAELDEIRHRFEQLNGLVRFGMEAQKAYDTTVAQMKIEIATLSNEVRAQRAGPWSLLRDYLIYRLLRTSFLISGIMSDRMSRRLARSAAKRDPARPPLGGKTLNGSATDPRGIHAAVASPDAATNDRPTQLA